MSVLYRYKFREELRDIKNIQIKIVRWRGS